MSRKRLVLATLAAIGAAAAYATAKPSTRAYIKHIGWYRPDLWLHGLFYLSRTEDYVRLGRFAGELGPVIPSWMKRRYADTYHGKIVPLDQAKMLVSVEEDIEVRDLENIVPYATCRDIVLEHPEEIIACKCVCRMTSENHCQPDEVCLLIGEPFVSFVLDHQPAFARRITRDEALEILEVTDSQGCIHAAFFKDVIGGQFYAICNCCKCCCVALKSHKFIGVPFYGHSGYMPVFSEECNACGKCAKACMFDALERRDEQVPALDLEACMGCGVCRAVCPSSAVTMVRAPGTPEPLDLEALRQGLS
jgi:Pyruvate/2-oxoacid:ferredoxin oxidoreductase delta subunit